MSPPPLVLASRSPQRPAILSQLGIPFEVLAPDYDERVREVLEPLDAVRVHACGKARSVAATTDTRPVLGVDTTVLLHGASYGKPADAAEAAHMLAALCGRTHQVASGLCLVGEGFEEVGHELTRVTFRSLSELEIERYVSTREWHDRAGGYAIQGRGAALVERVEGDYLNVVGLPATLLVRLLAERYPGVYGFEG